MGEGFWRFGRDAHSPGGSGAEAPRSSVVASDMRVGHAAILAAGSLPTRANNRFLADFAARALGLKQNPEGVAVAGELAPPSTSRYRLTRAPAPPMMASTSFTLAMLVSPGVVIASAPWAAP